MATDDLTAQRLRELLQYDSETGKFTRRHGSNRWAAGGAIGHVAPDGYVHIFIEGKRRKAHRLAWLYQYGEVPDGPLDHINGVRDDNRINNLRVATFFTNSQNLHAARSNNATGFLGVSKTRTGKYSATIVTTLAGRKVQLYLGAYGDPKSAHDVYLDAKRKLHDGCTI